MHPYRWVIENGESRILDSRRALTEAVPVKLKMGEYNTLRYEWPEIKVPAAVARKAVRPIDRMLEISAKLGI